ncbi:tRNA synthetases class I (M)-domain-containing protein [Phascolomyces articulosus]|uniref:Probable methionine--tRNA ligase, mitochondrial n=1 Tax=Phascolomyces articulosus TaxID=60185 RepID=A0AAD5KBJ8_9FUNG|nr:tRNA synthetases class I (M)-domain-containing protein [Phascolomyces articulosus]
MKHSTAFITTPIYYVNAVPHIGHLYSSVIADTLKRYYALKGADAYLCTGTDEHGLKIQQAAAKNNAPPIEFCNQVSKSFKELSDAADISYTSFIRTTEPRHAKAVAALWTELEKKGYIYKGKHEGWYAVSDEAFYASNQVQEAVDEKTGEKIMVSTESGQRVEWTEEENYKFKLSAFEEPLLKWIDDNPTAIVPSNRKNEVTQWIKQGLADLSISRLRSRLDWGIPVPNDPGHTIYVWLDALTNYLTVNGYPWITTENNKGEGTQNSKITNAWPADVHVVGKDIVRFHAIYWPAFLMAAQLPLPKQILAHAHWTMGKQKMSKSRGNVADPFQVMNTYGVDPVRYYLVRDGGFADDGDYSEENIIKRYKDLAGQLGNLLNRCTAPSLNPNATIPATPKNSDARDETLRTKLAELPGIFDESFESREFGKGISAVFDMLAEANKNFQDNKPWDLVKDPSQKERLDQVIYHAIESCRVAGILLQPVLPSKMNTLLTRLGVPSEKRSLLDAYPQQEQSETPLGENREPVLFPRLKK